MNIRELSNNDFNNGFLDTLKNLSSLDGLSLDKTRSLYSSMINNPVYHIYVMEENSQIVGCITLLIEQKFIHDGGLVGHIEDVATRSGWERKGIGSKLVNHTVEEAKKFECYKVILDCSPKNAPFYEKLGFHQHELSMRLDIK